MSTHSDLARGYRLLLRLYPSKFQGQFSSEMKDVFNQAAEDAARQGKWALLVMCWRELRDWPMAVFKQHLFSWRMEIKTMNEMINTGNEIHDLSLESTSQEAKLSSWGKLAALLPFFAWGALCLYKAVIDIFPEVSVPIRLYQLSLAVHLFTLVWLGVGWWLKFPSWSYLYAGLAITFSANWAGLAMNGWYLLGFYFLEDSRWSWRAWLPFLALVVLMLLITRSLQPLRQFFIGMWMDWSRLSLALYGWLVSLLIGVTLDSIEFTYELWQPVFMVIAFIGGLYLYLGAESPWKRALGLDLGLFVGVVGAILIDQIFYPDITRLPSLSIVAAENRMLYIFGMSGWVLLWLGLVFLPAVLVLFQRTKKVASST